MHFVLDGFTLS